MRRLLIMMSVLTLVVAAAFGGGQSETSAASSDELEPITVKVLMPVAETESSLDTEIGQMIYDEFKVEIQAVAVGGDYRERALTMLAGQNFGDLDLMVVGNNTNASKYIEAGALVNLDDYKDRLPNYYSYCADYIPYLRLFDPEDGLYLWQAGPDINAGIPGFDMMVRTDALEALNWPRLDTTSDYVSFLEDALELFPKTGGIDTIGMTIPGDGTLGTRLLSYLPRHGGFQIATPYTILYDVDNEKYVSLPESPYYKETLRFWNELHRKGLLDREAFTTTLGNQVEMMQSGYSICNFFPTWTTNQVNTALKQAGLDDMQYISLPIRLDLSKQEGKKRYESYTMVRADDLTGILSTAPEDHIERIIDVVNFMAREEMTILSGWGKENVHYTVDENGLRVPTDALIELSEQEDGINNLHGRFLSRLFPTRDAAITSNGQDSRVEFSAQFGDRATTPRQRQVLDAYGWDNFLSPFKESEYFDFEWYDITLATSASILDPNSDLGFKSDACTQLLDELYPLVVIAETEEEFEVRYADMVRQIKRAGVDDVVTYLNAQYRQQAQEIESLR